LKNYSYSIWKGVLKACGVSKDYGGGKCKETGSGAKSSFFAKKNGKGNMPESLDRQKSQKCVENDCAKVWGCTQAHQGHFL
jgi:hypothetical protein